MIIESQSRMQIKSKGTATLTKNYHCVKSVRIRSYSGSHFPAFGLNTERYGVNSEQRTPTGLKKLFFIERCLLLGGNLKKIVTFRTKCFVRYSLYVRYLGCPLLGGFTVLSKHVILPKTANFGQIKDRSDVSWFLYISKPVTLKDNCTEFLYFRVFAGDCSEAQLGPCKTSMMDLFCANI